MLTPSWWNTSTFHQLPLFSGSSRIEEILSIPSDEFGRIHQLLKRWADIYGKVSIQVDRSAIIIGRYRIALEDIAPKNALKNGITTLDGVSFSPQENLLTTRPGSVDMVEPEAWIALIDNIPGIWAERRDNLLELLGNKCFAHKDDFYEETYGDGYGVYFAYHTSESLWDDDGKYYWQLFIRSLPIPMHGRHGSEFMDEYAVKYPIDRELRDYGDEYIHFDVFPVHGAPPATMRTYGDNPIKN